MAKSFGDTKGGAIKRDSGYVMKDGENTLRLVGGVLPRYVYWLKGTNNKDIPIESLSFDRDLEKFTNIENDGVQDTFGRDKKCSWAYSINCIDPTDGKVKVFNLKKKLYEQIMTAAEDLGDPTDPQTGWDIVFKKVKTGPLPFNVEYTLNVLRCKKRALTEVEIAAVAAAPTIDSVYPRPTPEETRALCEKIKNGQAEEEEGSGQDSSTLAEVVNELDNA
jgi:hypothetical protein